VASFDATQDATLSEVEWVTGQADHVTELRQPSDEGLTQESG